jgi:hypothetical protein
MVSCTAGNICNGPLRHFQAHYVADILLLQSTLTYRLEYSNDNCHMATCLPRHRTPIVITTSNNLEQVLNIATSVCCCDSVSEMNPDWGQCRTHKQGMVFILD